MANRASTAIPLHARQLVHKLVDGGWDLTCTRTPESQGPATVTVTGEKDERSILVVWELPWPRRYRLLSCWMSDGQSVVRDATLRAVTTWLINQHGDGQ